mgnify:FL=1|tara:strand:- start:11 stop:166 length:156 start_codon:yes stop_codon:yes gene_type:complete
MRTKELINYSIFADGELLYEDSDKIEINKVVKELREEGFEGEVQIVKEIIK